MKTWRVYVIEIDSDMVGWTPLYAATDVVAAYSTRALARTALRRIPRQTRLTWDHRIRIYSADRTVR